MNDTPPPQPGPIGEESESDKALRVARVLRLRKDNWGALAEAQRACELDQFNVAAHDLAAGTARDLLQWDTALFHMEQAQHLDPENAARGARLEKLRRDAVVYSHSVTEVMAGAREGDASWADVFRSVFLRPDPTWHRSGWFHSLMAAAGLILFVFALKWALTTGPLFFLLAILHLAMVGWVTYDARLHGEPILFWGPVAMFGSVFGLALYLTVRGMGSGIGMQGGGKFFSG
jgi:hypothetical protein